MGWEGFPIFCKDSRGGAVKCYHHLLLQQISCVLLLFHMMFEEFNYPHYNVNS